MKPVLLDTGPVVAFLDKADACHSWVRDSWSRAVGGSPLVTTSAVITEVFFLMQRNARGPRQAAAFFGAAQVRVQEVFLPEQLSLCAGLMEQYRDTPMDFADASLVLAATLLDTAGILTLDERGFRTYRFRRNQRFELLLQSDALK